MLRTEGEVKKSCILSKARSKIMYKTNDKEETEVERGTKTIYTGARLHDRTSFVMRYTKEAFLKLISTFG